MNDERNNQGGGPASGSLLSDEALAEISGGLEETSPAPTDTAAALDRRRGKPGRGTIQ